MNCDILGGVLPEDDQVHAALVCLVVLSQAELCHAAKALHGGHLGVVPLLRLLHVRPHVVSKHQVPQVLLHQLGTTGALELEE